MIEHGLHQKTTWQVGCRLARSGGPAPLGNQADKKTAQDRLAEILQGSEPAEVVDIRTFKEYGEWWLENVAKGAIKASTYQEYEAVLRNHVYPVLGSKPFVDVKRPMIRGLIAAKKAEGYEQSTIRNVMAPVRGMFFQAMDDEITDTNPAGRVGKLNKRAKDPPQKKINPLTNVEVATLLKTTIGTAKYASCIPCFFPHAVLAARMGELIALKGIDIDFKGRFVHV